MLAICRDFFFYDDRQRHIDRGQEKEVCRQKQLERDDKRNKSRRNLDAIKDQLSKTAFDRIILLNCLHQITHDDQRSESRTTNTTVINPLMAFINMLRKSLAGNGKLVIIHREPNINTLPLPVEVINSWYNANTHSARLIEQLHRERKKNLEVLWEVETIKFGIQKLNWFNLLIHRTFYPLMLNSQRQVNSDISYFIPSFLSQLDC